MQFVTNGFVMDKDRVVFDTEDPQILILDIPEGAAILEVDFRMDCASPKIGAFLRELERLPRQQEEELNRLREQLEQRERLIWEMENTKVWKTYQKLKKMTGKGR